MSSSTEETGFVPLGTYKWPAMPTQETVRRLLDRFSHKIASQFQKDEEPAVAKDKLHRITRSVLDNVVAPPSCGPLTRELQQTISARLSSPDPLTRSTLIVLPPCDRSCVIRSWAEQNGHQILEPPARSELMGSADEPLPDLIGEGVLVIPRLEHWFLRHHKGLDRLRQLLAALDRLDRPCLIGCNSWAWRYLVAATDADLVLPSGMTFQAFDAERLHQWFSEMVGEDGLHSLRFRLSDSGKDVMAVDSNSKLENDYFQTLAATSFGIPWVAWHLWRRSLRSENGDAPVDKDEALDERLDEQTLWIAALEEFRLPGSSRQEALLVLQSLLIHGELSESDLVMTLPAQGIGAVLPALRTAGFIDRDGDIYRCHPTAYPSIRSGLSAAGFAVDRL
ncbi:MAG: hypothetical protein WBP11_11020 [Dokdonella sp.]